MSRSGACVVCFLAILGFGSSLQAATPQEVDKAIKRGVEWLYTQQNDGGHWETTPGPGRDFAKEPAKPESGQWGGYSSMATYALLDAGESWKDKRIRDALEWLNKAPMVGTYAVALRAQVWQYLPQTKGVKDAAQRDCGMLLSGMKAKGDARGMWAYFVSDGAHPRYDHSTSQIALLGVWACNQAGREVPTAFWKESENAWKAHQNEDGGWSYIYKGEGEQGSSKMSMTLAGVATLFIAQDYVHANDGINCGGNVFDDRLIWGTRWIKDHIGEGINGGYNLYAAQRVGLASGFKHFGKFDWYQQSAERLVRGQQKDGSWGSIAETSFAMIVLSRGRAPIIMNKFEYEMEGTAPKGIKKAPKPIIEAPKAPVPVRLKPGEKRPVAPPKPEEKPAEVKPPEEPVDPEADPKLFAGNWCQRPRDVALFTRWMSDATERKLNWQVISSRATVDDFHDAPVLYMAGNQKLTLPQTTVDKIKQYIEEGGLLFGQADCASKEFTESFIALGKQMFPMYEFRELPADHPIYSRQQFLRKNWKNPPSVMALSNGTRELMITLPSADIARNWQMGTYLGKEETFQVMNGIVLYAVDRQNLKYKGGTHVVRADPAAAGGTGGGRVIKVARLEFVGNWNPEPAGWPRLSAILQKQQQGQIVAEPVKLGEGKLDAAAYPIAHLTGTGQFSFTKEQLNELKKYVLKGGVVLCDAAGGNSEFATAAADQLDNIITGSKLEPITADDPAMAAGKGPDAAAAPMITSTPIVQPENSMASVVAAATQAATQPSTQPAGKTLFPTLPPAATQPATTQASTKVLLPGGFPVEYRSFARARLGSSDNLRLKGLKFRKKWAVVYSAEDLSTGLVGQQVDGINGYTPACATEIMRRLVLNLVPVTAGETPAAAQQ
ncbi:MAG: hypothetical protein JWN40_3477 [Phycisphaerales bacterium]|nr:hypothetical protein [Phycisphaerales bacterium]